jgi:hypothetical protein
MSLGVGLAELLVRLAQGLLPAAQLSLLNKTSLEAAQDRLDSVTLFMSVESRLGETLELEHRNVDFGNRSVDRFTYGLNLDIVGGSGLSINHEHWMFGNTSDVDVLGARWTATF